MGGQSTKDATGTARETVDESIPSFKTKFKTTKGTMHEEIYTRWLYPLVSLADDAWVKVILAALGSLFASETQLVLLVTLLVIGDFITGVFAAKRRGEKIESWGFRQTGIKTIEYIVLLMCVTMVSNSFDIMAWLAPMAYLFISMTELKSIAENTFDPEGNAANIFNSLKRELRNRIPMDEDGNPIDENGNVGHS